MIDSVSNTPSVGMRPLEQIEKTSFASKPKSDGATAPMVDFTFDDFIDIINPLHHIPVVNLVYRDFAEDKISPHSRIIGDILYGAATGAVSVIIAAACAIGDEIFAASSDKGQRLGEYAIASLFGDEAQEHSDIQQTQRPEPVVNQRNAANSIGGVSRKYARNIAAVPVQKVALADVPNKTEPKLADNVIFDKNMDPNTQKALEALLMDLHTSKAINLYAKADSYNKNGLAIDFEE
ncbi:MAG: hypothetical protein FWF23_01230 [Alphaproteobacteria bacterium]|nr:hypothetical protein [Alphaproteobacteria bacterium]MCL2505262.1 hypothetical protein [Alphaproteobacteria bacterium]